MYLQRATFTEGRGAGATAWEVGRHQQLPSRQMASANNAQHIWCVCVCVHVQQSPGKGRKQASTRKALTSLAAAAAAAAVPAEFMSRKMQRMHDSFP
eukprot:1139474-Pelagomonas_calceolata.AAC.4